MNDDSENMDHVNSKGNGKETGKKEKYKASNRYKSKSDSELVICTHDILTNSSKYIPNLLPERFSSNYVSLTAEKEQHLDFMLLLFQSPEIKHVIYSVFSAPYSNNSLFIECSTPRIVISYLKENGFENIKAVQSDDALVILSGASKLPFKRFFGDRLFAECVAPPYFSAPVEILDIDLFKKTAIVRALPIFAVNSQFQMVTPIAFLQNTKVEQASRITVPLKYDMSNNVEGFSYKSISVVNGYFIIEFPLTVLKTWTANFDQRINLFIFNQNDNQYISDINTNEKQKQPLVSKTTENKTENIKTKKAKRFQIEKVLEYTNNGNQSQEKESEVSDEKEKINESSIPKPDFTQMSDTIEQTIISPGGHTHRVQINIPLILPGSTDADVDGDIVAHPRHSSSALQDQVIPTLDFRKGNIGRRPLAGRRDREEQMLGLLLKNGPLPTTMTQSDDAKQKKRLEKERKRAEKEIEEKRFAEMEKARQSRAASQQTSASTTPLSTPVISKPQSEAPVSIKAKEKDLQEVCVQTETSSEDISKMEELLARIKESMSTHVSAIEEIHKK